MVGVMVFLFIFLFYLFFLKNYYFEDYFNCQLSFCASLEPKSLLSFKTKREVREFRKIRFWFYQSGSSERGRTILRCVCVEGRGGFGLTQLWKLVKKSLYCLWV